MRRKTGRSDGGICNVCSSRRRIIMRRFVMDVFQQPLQLAGNEFLRVDDVNGMLPLKNKTLTDLRFLTRPATLTFNSSQQPNSKITALNLALV
jgi:hypothetical protein